MSYYRVRSETARNCRAFIDFTKAMTHFLAIIAPAKLLEVESGTEKIIVEK